MMSTETPKLIDASTTGVTDDKNVSTFEPMASWFLNTSKEYIQDLISAVRNGEGVILKYNGDLFDVWINNIDDSIRQEYNCRTCGSFLTGVGSLVYVYGDDYEITPFALPPADNNTPPEWVQAYTNLREFLANNKGHLIVPHSGMDRSAWYGNKDTTHPEKGYFTHFYSGVPVDELEIFFSQHLITPRGHGVGSAEIKSMSAWFNMICDTDFSMINPSDVRTSDRDHLATFELIQSDLKERKIDQTIYARYWLARNGLHVLNLKNSSVGQIIVNIADGVSAEQAIGKYRGMTDARYYRRPIRLPGEKELEASVSYIESKGYDKWMQLRLATLDDIVVDWSREVVAAPSGLFDKLRKKVADTKSDTTEVKKSNFSTPEKISLTAFVNKILKKELYGPVEGIVYRSTNAFAGSIAVSTHQEEGVTNPIFKDGKHPVRFIFSDPMELASTWMRHSQLGQWTNLDINRSCDHYIIVQDKERDEVILNLIYADVEWKIPLNTPLFPNSLINELYEHRRVIEHYAQNTMMNVDENGNVLPLSNTLFSINVAVGTMVEVEFDKSIRKFEFTSVE